MSEIASGNFGSLLFNLLLHTNSDVCNYADLANRLLLLAFSDFNRRIMMNGYRLNAIRSDPIMRNHFLDKDALLWVLF